MNEKKLLTLLSKAGIMRADDGTFYIGFIDDSDVTDEVNSLLAFIRTEVQKAEARKLDKLIWVLSKAKDQSQAVIDFDRMWYALPEDIRDSVRDHLQANQKGGEENES